MKGTTRCKNSAYRDTEVKDNGVVGKIANSPIRLENLGGQRRSSEDLEVHELITEGLVGCVGRSVGTWKGLKQHDS